MPGGMRFSSPKPTRGGREGVGPGGGRSHTLLFFGSLKVWLSVHGADLDVVHATTLQLAHVHVKTALEIGLDGVCVMCE